MKRSLIAGIIALSLAGFFAGCEGGSSGQPAGDHVTTISPANGATDVPVTSTITVSFNVNLDETTLTSQNITLTRANNAVNVPGSITYDATTKTLTFTPTFPMAAGALHTFTIGAGAHTKAVGDYATTFTTVTSPLLYVSSIDPADPAAATSYNVWSVDPSAENNTRLTSYVPAEGQVLDFIGINANAAWSPDYMQIAYISLEGGLLTDISLKIVPVSPVIDLYVMNADGSGKQNVTNGTAPFYVLAHRWLPDGSKIVVAFTTDEILVVTPVYNLASVKPDGTEFTQLTTLTGNGTVEESAFTISPDGTKIAYLISDSVALTTNLHIMNVDGSGDIAVTAIADADHGAIAGGFSSDSERIYYSASTASDCGIYSANVDGTDVQTIVSAASGETLTVLPFNSSPAVSPDGTRLLYFATQTSGAIDIYAVNVDGSSPVKLTSSTGATDVGIVAAWSPDGTKVLYSFGNSEDGPSNLHVVNPDGTGDVAITNNTGTTIVGSTPLWSPDGSQIFYDDYDTAASVGNIHVVNADGSAKTDLTSTTVAAAYTYDWW